MEAAPTNMFKVLKWSGVAEWRFDIETPEHCAICKSKLTDKCIHCEADNLDKSACHISWGKCKHAYHYHCIQPWVTKHTKCPLDQEIWGEIRNERI